ncbi:hypothetical protein RKD45_005819 [Streptomyces griseus]
MSPKDVSSGSGGAFSPARIAVTLLAVLTIVFICVNTTEVTIRVIIPKVTMPLWAALLGVFVGRRALRGLPVPPAGRALTVASPSRAPEGRRRGYAGLITPPGEMRRLRAAERTRSADCGCRGRAPAGGRGER